MENFSGYHVPFYVVTGGVATSGHSADLTPGKVGIYDRQTFSVATSSGNGKEFFLAQGRIGGLDWYGEKVTETHKSPFFYGSDVEKMWMVKPQTIQNEEWVVGYNGADSDVGISFKTGKRMGIKFLFGGEPAYRFFNGPKEYVVSYTPLEDCDSSDCTGGCDDATLDCEAETIKLINKINNHTELKKFGVKARLKTTGLVATTPNMEKFKLSVCDNGDSVALAAVQSQYPSLKVERTSRTGSTSVYEVCVVGTEGDDTPAAFTQSGSVSYAVCGDCPTGSVVSPAQDVYFINRPLAGTEDFTSDASKLAYARTVAAAYFGKTFNATSGVDDSTETISVTAHGFTEGQAVVFSVATGLIVGGITAGTTYYVIAAGLTANAFRVSATRGGSAVNLTDAVGTNTVTPAPAVFLNQTGDVANIKVSVPAGTTVAALLSDSATQIATEGAVCEPAAGSSTSWVQGAGGYTVNRTLNLTVGKLDCSEAVADTLADVQAVYANVPSVVSVASISLEATEGCIKQFLITQKSQFMDDVCLGADVPSYDILPTYKGNVPVENVTVPEFDASVKVGVRVAAPFYSNKFDDCSFDPQEFYYYEPLRMELAIWDQSGNNCLIGTNAVGRKVKDPMYNRLEGEYVIRQYIKNSGYYKFMDWEQDVRMREVTDNTYLSTVKRNKYYVAYHFKFKSYKGAENFDTKGEFFEPVIFIEEDDKVAQTAFESAMLSITSKWGVTLEDRIVD